MSKGPLQGLKVLDLSRVLAGPWAAQLLGDYGAEVIKVERPKRGDETRHWGPPWTVGKTDQDERTAAYFLSANRNKRSLTVDFSHKLGRRVIQQLAADSDILIENYKVGTLQRHGLGAKHLCEANPYLIYCSISAFGQTGSRATRPGYDAMIQASGGLMSITGDIDGSPQKVGVAAADIMAGMYAVTAILAALNERGQTGRGQHIDVPLYDSQVAWLANQNMNYLLSGQSPVREGTAHPNIVPYQSFGAADGHFMLAVGSDEQFRRCVECIGLADYADDARFHSNEARVENRHILVENMQSVLKLQTVDYWLEHLAKYGIPAGPINSIETVLTDDYAEERKLVRTIEDSSSGMVPTVANPVRFSEAAVEYTLAPPELGAHTDEILRGELGYSDRDIKKLREIGVV